MFLNIWQSVEIPQTLYGHYSDTAWVLRCLKSPVIRRFVQQLVKAHTKDAKKKNLYSALLALFEGNPSVTSEYLSQSANNAENVSMS